MVCDIVTDPHCLERNHEQMENDNLQVLNISKGWVLQTQIHKTKDISSQETITNPNPPQKKIKLWVEDSPNPSRKIDEIAGSTSNMFNPN